MADENHKLVRTLTNAYNINQRVVEYLENVESKCKESITRQGYLNLPVLNKNVRRQSLTSNAYCNSNNHRGALVRTGIGLTAYESMSLAVLISSLYSAPRKRIIDCLDLVCDTCRQRGDS